MVTSSRHAAPAPTPPSGGRAGPVGGPGRATGTRKRTVPATRRRVPEPPLATLAVDIGGTGLKASVLDDTGQMEHDRVRIPTPYPLSPQKLVTVLEDLIKPLPPFDRVSVGFPGHGPRRSHPVRAALRVPGRPRRRAGPEAGQRPGPASTSSRSWPGSPASPPRWPTTPTSRARRSWRARASRLVLTLGTGVGTAFFLDGRLLPHFEFSHTPFRKGGTYNEELGEAARRTIGTKKWQRRVLEAIETFRALTFFDHCYIGGGNSAAITCRSAARCHAWSTTAPASSAASSCGSGQRDPDRHGRACL